MPLSTFDGETSQELHEHFDPDGNPTGTTVVSRPGWSEDDRTWALALTLRDASHCPGCGGDLAETTDYDYRWVPEKPVVCFRCVGSQAAVKATEKDPWHRAMLHPVKKVPRKRRR